MRLDSAGELLEAKVLEAYVEEDNCTFEQCARANMGKQRLSKDQTGWLLLDLEWGVFPGDRVVK